eukprot:gene3546-6281_t
MYHEEEKPEEQRNINKVQRHGKEFNVALAHVCRIIETKWKDSWSEFKTVEFWHPFFIICTFRKKIPTNKQTSINVGYPIMEEYNKLLRDANFQPLNQKLLKLNPQITAKVEEQKERENLNQIDKN